MSTNEEEEKERDRENEKIGDRLPKLNEKKIDTELEKEG